MVISNDTRYGPIGIIFALLVALLAYLTAIGVVVILGAVVGLAWYESSSCGKSEIGDLPLPPGGMTIIYRHLAADEQRARQVIAGVLAALSKDRGEPQIKRLFCKSICKRDAVEQDGGSDPAAAAGC